SLDGRLHLAQGQPDVGVLAAGLKVRGWSERKTVLRNDGDRQTVIGRFEPELVRRPRDIEPPQRCHLCVVGADELGPQLAAKANTNADIGAVLGVGGARSSQKERGGNQKFFHCALTAVRGSWLHSRIGLPARRPASSQRRLISFSTIKSAASSALSLVVSMWISACSGGSYGLSMPVKFLSSPARALA